MLISILVVLGLSLTMGLKVVYSRYTIIEYYIDIGPMSARYCVRLWADLMPTL